MPKISLTAKCSDMCYMELENADGTTAEHNGYVPDWMPGDHDGDYVCLTIDLETGKILNWEKPSDEALQKTFGKG
jgi:hypothetical protein